MVRFGIQIVECLIWDKRIFTNCVLCTGHSARHFYMLPHLFFTITLTRGISILKDLLAHGSQTGSSRAENLFFVAFTML